LRVRVGAGGVCATRKSREVGRFGCHSHLLSYLLLFAHFFETAAQLGVGRDDSLVELDRIFVCLKTVAETDNINGPDAVELLGGVEEELSRFAKGLRLFDRVTEGFEIREDGKDQCRNSRDDGNETVMPTRKSGACRHEVKASENAGTQDGGATPTSMGLGEVVVFVDAKVGRIVKALQILLVGLVDVLDKDAPGLVGKSSPIVRRDSSKSSALVCKAAGYFAP